MKGPNKTINARYSATCTITEEKGRPYVNHAQDHVWQAKIMNGQLPPAIGATLADNGAWPTNQPCAPTSHTSTPGEGGWVHP
jgi:hypothetical protein